MVTPGRYHPRGPAPPRWGTRIGDLYSGEWSCRWEATMWFKKPRAIVCAVCGKTIAPSERRFVEKNRATRTERHAHVNCSPDARHELKPSPESA